MPRRHTETEADEVWEPAPSLSVESILSRIGIKALVLLEERITSGTASSQELVEACRMVTHQEDRKLETQKLINENKALEAKVRALDAQTNNEEFNNRLLKLIALYNGEDEEVVGYDKNIHKPN